MLAASARTARSLLRCSRRKPSNLFSHQPAVSNSQSIFSQLSKLCHFMPHFVSFTTGRIPKTDAMIPRHGFVSGLFGRRTRSFGSGGSGRWVTDLAALLEPEGLGTIVGEIASSHYTILRYRSVKESRIAGSVVRAVVGGDVLTSGVLEKWRGAMPHPARLLRARAPMLFVVGACSWQRSTHSRLKSTNFDPFSRPSLSLRHSYGITCRCHCLFFCRYPRIYNYPLRRRRQWRLPPANAPQPSVQPGPTPMRLPLTQQLYLSPEDRAPGSAHRMSPSATARRKRCGARTRRDRRLQTRVAPLLLRRMRRCAR